MLINNHSDIFMQIKTLLLLNTNFLVSSNDQSNTFIQNQPADGLLLSIYFNYLSQLYDTLNDRLLNVYQTIKFNGDVLYSLSL